MEHRGQSRWRMHVVIRLVVIVLVGVAVSVLVGLAAGWTYAPSVGWITAACVYLVWTCVVVLPMDAEQTRNHVEPEDPPLGLLADVIVLATSVASVAGVAHLLAAGSKAGAERHVAAAVGVVSVIAAWCVVHTVFSVRYADVYYSNSARGINFNGTEDPRFLDFFYIGFGIGMTYQVSDTSLATSQLRRIALCQALLSYFFGTVILATTINLVIELSNSTG
jgi:uncharacterized membrane protein